MSGPPSSLWRSPTTSTPASRLWKQSGPTRTERTFRSPNSVPQRRRCRHRVEALSRFLRRPGPRATQRLQHRHQSHHQRRPPERRRHRRSQWRSAGLSTSSSTKYPSISRAASSLCRCRSAPQCTDAPEAVVTRPGYQSDQTAITCTTAVSPSHSTARSATGRSRAGRTTGSGTGASSGQTLRLRRHLGGDGSLHACATHTVGLDEPGSHYPLAASVSSSSIQSSASVTAS